MGAVKENGMAMLIQTVSQLRGIPPEAAEDLIEHIQSLIWERRQGMGSYTSDAEILIDFGIKPDLLWVFD